MTTNPYIDDYQDQEAKIVARFDERFQSGTYEHLFGEELLNLFHFFDTHPFKALSKVLSWGDDLLGEAKGLDTIRYSRAAEFVRRGMVDRGLEEMDILITDNKVNEDTWIYRAGLLVQTGRLEEALTSVNMAIEANPRAITALVQRGIIYAKLHDFSEALSDFEKVIEINPSIYEGYGGKADVLALTEDFKSSLQYYSLAIDRSPKQARLYFNRANAFTNTNQLEKAFEDLEVAVSLEPNNSEYRSQRDLVQIVLDGFEKNMESVLLNPERGQDLSKLELLGYFYFKNGDRVNAKYYFSESINEDPHNLRAFIQLSILLTEDKQNGELVNIAHSLLVENAHSAKALLIIADVLFSIKEFPSALSAIERAIELSPDDGQLFLMRGFIYLGLGDKRRGETDHEKAKVLGVVVDKNDKL